MDWVLFVVVASTAMSDNKAVHTSAVPMATQQLCTAAKDKLAEAYKRSAKPQFRVYRRMPASALTVGARAGQRAATFN